MPGLSVVDRAFGFGKRRRWSASAFLALAALQGCVLGPDYQQPPPPDAAGFTRSAAVDNPINGAASDPVAATGSTTEWWRAYGSQHINDLVTRTLAHNPNLSAAIANLRQAQENVNVQRGLFYPQININSADSRQRTGKILQSSLNSGSSIYDLHTVQLNVGFIPDIFGENTRQVESLEAIASNTSHQLDALRLTLISNVVAAGLQEQLLLELKALALDSIRTSSQLTAQAHFLAYAGYTDAFDVAVQDAADASTAAVLPPIEKQLEQTRDLIAILCGDLPADAPVVDSAGPLIIPTEWPRTVPSDWVEARPDIQAAADSLRAANALIGVAKAARFPQVQLTGNLATTNTMLSNLFTAGSQIGTIADTITQPIFLGGSLAARQRAAQAATDAARAQYESVVLTAFQNVADTLYALDQDGRAMNAAVAAEDAARRQLDIIRRQATAGYVARPALLQAEINDLQARINANQSRGTYLGDTVALHQALGGNPAATDQH